MDYIPPAPRAPVRRSHIVMIVVGGALLILAPLGLLVSPLVIMDSVDWDLVQSVPEGTLTPDEMGITSGLWGVIGLWAIAGLLFVVGVTLAVIGIVGVVRRPGQRWVFNPPPGWAPADPAWKPRVPTPFPPGASKPPAEWQFWLPQQ